MSNTDKLMELFNAGNLLLCKELMEGLNIKTLPVNLQDVCRNKRKGSTWIEYAFLQPTIAITISEEDSDYYKASKKDNTYEISFYENMDQTHHDSLHVKDVLAQIGLLELMEYDIMDTWGESALGAVPHNDVLRILFANEIEQ